MASINLAVKLESIALRETKFQKQRFQAFDDQACIPVPEEFYQQVVRQRLV
ncbi:MAG TPA: hypothetical protein V6D10_25635 [Trichocoleus sp.]